MVKPNESTNASQIEAAVALARVLQERATALQTAAERRQQAELDRMLQTPEDKITLVQLTDQAFRCQSSARTAEHLTHILDVQGVPRFFSPMERTLLRGFQTFGGWLPALAYEAGGWPYSLALVIGMLAIMAAIVATWWKQQG